MDLTSVMNKEQLVQSAVTRVVHAVNKMSVVFFFFIQ